MLKEGHLVYYLMNGYVMNGKVVDLVGNEKEYTFSIEGYAGCAGPHILSSKQLHLTVFLSQEEAEKYKDIPQMYLPAYC
ncbi:hypothetical protein [Beduini massiliensis]|uniref:hypothetical protein n=1 Tax=Beduini massiliensis TaxID=1585974 RepID=UPI00059AA98F|nr:hypothetical protein [Beduini massiliensis]